MADLDYGPWTINRNGCSLRVEHPIIAAPMAGGLDPPYRMVLHELGCPLSFTEMLSARAICEGVERTKKFYSYLPDRGLSGAQIFGHDAEYLSFAAKEMERFGHDLIDLNIGCPKRKVTRTGSGSAMLKDPDNMIHCVSSILDSTKVPVGVKMRMGYHHYEEKELRSMVKDLNASGISWMTMHPRTTFQQYSGTADRDVISKMSDWIDIPLIASGDVRSCSDVLDYLQRGATAVMVARGILGDPTWINRVISSFEGEEFQKRYPSTREQIRDHFTLLLKQLDNTIEWYGEERGCIEFRSHFSWYLKRFKMRREFRNGLYSLTTKDKTVERVREIEKAWLGQEDMTKF